MPNGGARDVELILAIVGFTDNYTASVVRCVLLRYHHDCPTKSFVCDSCDDYVTTY